MSMDLMSMPICFLICHSEVYKACQVLFESHVGGSKAGPRSKTYCLDAGIQERYKVVPKVSSIVQWSVNVRSQKH